MNVVCRRSIPTLILVGLAVGGLAACGDDADTGTTSLPATTQPAPSTTATANTAAGTTPPPTTASGTTASGTITVTVGVDSGDDRVARVRVGEPITLTIVNPDADDEFHVHGLDLGDDVAVPKGTPKTFSFSFTEPGTYDVESHATDAVLIVFEVTA